MTGDRTWQVQQGKVKDGLRERGKALKLLGGWRAFQLRTVLPGEASVYAAVLNKEGMMEFLMKY